MMNNNQFTVVSFSLQIAITALPCGHTFHGSCIEQWFKSVSNCPSCRTQVDQNKVVWKLFFDCDTEQGEGGDCGKLTNQVRELQVKLSEKDKSVKDLQGDNESLLKKCKGLEKEKKQLDAVMRDEKLASESLKKQVQYYQYNQNSLEKEKEECRKIKRKFVEYQNIEKILTGEVVMLMPFSCRILHVQRIFLCHLQRLATSRRHFAHASTHNQRYSLTQLQGSSGGRVVKLLACGVKGPGFDSRPGHLNFQRLVISCFQSRDKAEIPLKRRKSSIQPTTNSDTKHC